MKFELTGQLPKGVYAKDAILYIINQIGVNGATNCVMEFTGNIVEEMSIESRMTLCNMAIEAGGTSGICYPDMTTVDYLWPFIQDEFDSKEQALEEYSQWRSDADAKYEAVYTYDLSDLEPMVTFGF